MKTVCYIDASNLMRTGYPVDHEKLFNYIKERFNPDKIIYCGALFVGDFYKVHNFNESDYVDFNEINKFFEEREENNDTEKVFKQLGFLEELVNIGFEMKIKPLKIMLNGKRKADCDVNITVEGMSNLNNFNKLILFSGDGDFMPFLRYLKDQNKDVEVYSFWKLTAREIREFLGGKWNNLEVKHYKDKIGLNK